jgi:hypothetical protein
MAKYPVMFQKGNDVLKRSITIESMELLFIMSNTMIVKKTKRKSGEIKFSFIHEDILSVATVKKVPIWVMKRFKPETEWK